MNRKLIRNATIISMDPVVGDLQGGSILIEGSKILEIGKSISVDDAEVIDATNCIAIPPPRDWPTTVTRSIPSRPR